MGVYLLYIDNGHAPNPKTLSTSVPGILTLSDMNMLTKYIHKSRVGEFMAHVRLYSDIDSHIYIYIYIYILITCVYVSVKLNNCGL